MAYAGIYGKADFFLNIPKIWCVFGRMVYTLSKRYAHAEYARGTLEVRYSQVEYAGHTMTYAGMKVYRTASVLIAH